MKTKHILTAIALPALLAACSQDEDLSGALSQKDFSNIPTVDVNFTASIDGNSPTTRMATRFDWEEGDKVGFAWLGDGAVISKIDGNAYQNHPLFCTDPTAKSFETKTMLYVGSYYAYMPYNEKITSVVPMEFDASNQELAATSASYAKKAIYISPKLTKLDGETAGIGKNTKLNLSRLSNAVTVNLTFGNAAKFEGLKVMGISVDAKTSAPASVLPKSFTYKPTKDADVTDWSEMKSDKILAATSGNFFNISDGPAAATVGAIEATSKEGLAVTDDQLTTYILTLAATEAATKLEVVVSTNYGDVTVDLDSKGAGEADKAIVIKDKGTTEAKTIADAKIFNNFGASGSLDVYVDMSNLTIPSTVTTQAELNEALKTLAITETEKATTITVNPEKANSTNTVDLTDFTFPEGLKCAVTLTAGAKASKGFAFKGNTVINSQLTLASAATVDGTMTINNLVDDQKKQKAALTMDGKVLTINAGAKLINEGKIDISAGSSGITTKAEEGKVAAAEFVSNASTATVNVGSGIFTNGGKVQWIAGTLPTDLQGTVYANATTLNQLVGASEAFANNNASATNEVTIDGALSIGNQFQTLGFANIKKLTIKEKVTLSMKAKYTVTNLEEINIEAGSLNFTDGDDSSAKAFTPQAGCKLALSKGTELNVATGIKLNLGSGSSIIYKDAIVTNYGEIVAASTSGSGTSSWIGNSAVAP